MEKVVIEDELAVEHIVLHPPQLLLNEGSTVLICSDGCIGKDEERHNRHKLQQKATQDGPSDGTSKLSAQLFLRAAQMHGADEPHGARDV